MSAQAIGAAAAGVPAGELALAQRIQQLELLLAQTRAASGAAPAAAPAQAPAQAGPSFATALQAAVQTPTASGTEEAAGGGAYEALVQQAAARYGLDPAILHGLIQQESGFDPNSRSGAGAMGLTQLMPGTASSLGVANPMDPAESINGGARYLAQMMSQFGGNTSDALAAYNAGPGAVSQYGGIPPYAETEGYVTKVLGYAEAYRRAHPAPATNGVIA